jgi:hypothetical protein
MMLPPAALPAGWTGTLAAAQEFSQLRGTSTWPWNAWNIRTTNAEPNPLPVELNQVTCVAPGECVHHPLSIGTNAGRRFASLKLWTRVQNPPSSEPADSPRNALRDHYLERPISLMAPFNVVRFSRAIFDSWWRRRIRWLRPDPDPAPFIPRQDLVRRELFGIVTHDASSQNEEGSEFWSNGDSGAPVRGVSFVRLNARVATVFSTVPTHGPQAALPSNAHAAFASTDADEEGWPVVYAFGGHDQNGFASSSLHRATPATQPDGSVVYEWALLQPTIAPPARTRAVLVASATGKSLYLFGGRDGQAGPLMNDLWVYDVPTNSWTQRTLSVAIPARFDTSIAIREDKLYIGGGIDESNNALADLWRIDGTTGDTHGYGLVLPAGASADLAFDDHGDGLIYAGGYIGTTWYRDLWITTLDGDSASTRFVHDFSADGLVATENYAVVSDIEHQLFWAVPGYAPAGSAQGTWLLNGVAGTLIEGGSQGGSALRLVSPTPTLARRPVGRRGAPRSRVVRTFARTEASR